MANRYWVGGTGNWSDATNHWSASTGGAPGASLPTASDAAIFDASSFGTTGQIVTVDIVAARCLSMNWTGAAHTPALSFLAGMALNVYTDLTLVAGMTVTLPVSGAAPILWMRGTGTLTCAVHALPELGLTGSGTISMADDLYTNVFFFSGFTGTFNTVSHRLIISDRVQILPIVGDPLPTFNLGTSTVDVVGDWSVALGASLSASSSTLNVGRHFRGGCSVYNIVNLTGTTPALVDQSNSFGTLAITTPGKVVAFYDGATQQVTTFTANGAAGNPVTLHSWLGGSWTISKTTGTVSLDYVTIADSTATGGATWNAGTHSSDAGGNTGWAFGTGSNVYASPAGAARVRGIGVVFVSVSGSSISLDDAVNFGKWPLSSGITAGDLALTVGANGGHAAPAVAFNAVIWNSTDYGGPTDDPFVEIVRVTNVLGNRWTILRAQEGTGAFSHSTVGKLYSIHVGPTAKLVSDIAYILGTKSDVGHYHAETEVVGLVSDLAAKVNADGTVPLTAPWVAEKQITAPLSDKGGQVFNVKAYGAVGNAVIDETGVPPNDTVTGTDDYAAFVAAIAAAKAANDFGYTDRGSGVVLVPPGNYLLTAPLVIPRGVSLIGTGTAIGRGVGFYGATALVAKHTGAAALSLVGAGGCQIRNLAIYGVKASTPKAGLALGRVNSVSAGNHVVENVAVVGYYSVAGIYSIASEQNAWHSCTVQLTGVGTGYAKYCYYTSEHDDLSIGAGISEYPGGTRPPTNVDVRMGNCAFGWNGKQTAVGTAPIYINAGPHTKHHVFSQCYAATYSGAYVRINAFGDSLGPISFLGLSGEHQPNDEGDDPHLGPIDAAFALTAGGAYTLPGLTILGCRFDYDAATGTSMKFLSMDANVKLYRAFIKEPNGGNAPSAIVDANVTESTLDLTTSTGKSEAIIVNEDISAGTSATVAVQNGALTGSYAQGYLTTSQLGQRTLLGSNVELQLAAAGNDVSVEMGGSSEFAAIGGCAYSFVTPTGTDADLLEKTLATYTLPASALSATGKGVRISAWGNVAANANNKRIRLYFGTNSVYDTGVVTWGTASWSIDGLVIKSGTNTQRIRGVITSVLSTGAQTANGTQADTGAITVKLTGENGVASQYDVILLGFMVEVLN